MTSYRLTPAAQRDLAAIWDYIDPTWGARQAEAYISDIRAAIERIAADPSRGRPCDDIRQGYRRFGIGSHHVFSIERADAVDIIRILHRRMDPTRHV